jgi:fibronectin-binding autotransporter adhesin
VGAKTLTLTGTNTADNRIGGAIVNNATTGATATTASSTASTALVLASVDGLTVGNAISGTGITLGTTITAINTATKTVTLSAAATVASAATITSAGLVNTTSLTKDGTGKWVLSGANTYTGATTINAGTLSVTGTGTLGSGSSVTLADVAGATLDFTGATGNKGIGLLSGGGTTGGNVVIVNRISIGSASSSTYGGIISGSGQLQQAGAGTTTLSGNNTYTGYTIIGNNGALSINSIANVGGGASSLGAVASAATGKIFLGQTTTSGSLIYTGTGHSTDRQVDLAGTTGGATIDASGSGALQFTSAFTATGVGAKTLTLTGSNTADNRIGGAIVNSSSGATSLTKSGTGKWVLSGANTYTGGTTVSTGTLLVNTGASIASSASIVNGGLLRVNGAAGSVTVNSGGSLGGSGTVGALTLGSGGLLNPGNSPGLLTASSATWAAGSTYNWEIDSNASLAVAGTNWDLFSVTGALDMSALKLSTQMNLVLNSLSGFDLTSSTNRTWVIAQAGSLLGTGGAVLSAGDNVSDYFNINATAFTSVTPSLVSEWRIEVGETGKTLNLMAIPEPSTGSLLGFGLAGLVVTRLLRRRRNS